MRWKFFFKIYECAMEKLVSHCLFVRWLLSSTSASAKIDFIYLKPGGILLHGPRSVAAPLHPTRVTPLKLGRRTPTPSLRP